MDAVSCVSVNFLKGLRMDIISNVSFDLFGVDFVEVDVWLESLTASVMVIMPAFDSDWLCGVVDALIMATHLCIPLTLRKSD